ncbi:MAG TPA: histidinol-phosphatase HisJ [Bacteroidota bacterium]|nr:histidinol-phosphatase HisJ [Bacteroidota bacterium]
MIVDYHTHTALCKHAEGSVEDYVRKAVELGLDEIGCSEHIPMPEKFDEVHRMDIEQYYSEYAPVVGQLKEKYEAKLTVRRGIEADYYPGTEEWVRGFLKENPFDYVIGSVHFLGEWGFDDPIFVHHYDERDIDSTYEAYYEAIRKSARSGLFDIIGHCDLVKKFGHRPKKDMTEVVRETMKIIAEHGVCIEINTSGLRKPVREIYPSESILAMAKEFGVPLTLGSDAHSPEDVAKDFDKAVALVERYGGGKITVFEQRNRREVSVH